MENKESLRKELEKLSPRLARLKEEPDGMRIPGQYFEELPDRLMEFIQAETESEPVLAPPPLTTGWAQWIRAWLAPLQRPQWAGALALIALLAIGLWWFRPAAETVSAPADPFAQLAPEEIQVYIEKNIQNFDTDLLLELTDEVDDAEEDSLPELREDDDAVDEDLDRLLQELEDLPIDDIL